MLRNCLFIILFIANTLCYAQKVTLSGRVLEAGSNEALINATMYVVGEQKGTQTNQYGYFSITLPNGIHDIKFSYAGYTPFTLKKTFLNDTILNISLQSISLQEVVITENKQNRNVGFLNVPIEQLKKIPMLLGETDLLKALAMTPGISTGQEGSSGIYVRGSSPDQNLVLLDEAPVYNTSHAFGYLSVFNADAIKNIDVFKGGFPARFGGRLASILDITMKEGNNQAKKFELSLGVLSSRFLKEGPIKQGKSSYLIAGRLMNTLLLQFPQYLKTLTGGDLDGFKSLWFYDINAKINHRFDDNGQLLFSIYSNNDYYTSIDQKNSNKNSSILNWGSLTSSLRYNRSLGNKLFGKASLIFSRFNYAVSGENIFKKDGQSLTNAFAVTNTILDLGLKTSFEYNYSTTFTNRIGLEHIQHFFSPGQVTITKENIPEKIPFNQNESIYAHESAIFIENEITPFSLMKFNIGARFVNLLTQNTNYHGFEPRFSTSISITPHHSLKFGYTQMQQNLHQLTSNGVGVPNDIWVSATQKVPPSKASQIDIGYYWQLGSNKDWEISVEAYEKKMIQLIDYQIGADVVTKYQSNWQDIIVKDVKGIAKGIELMVQKKQGLINGWLSYTHAISQRKSPEINNGEWYYARYDRRHNLALVANTQVSPKWSVALNFIYQSGNPVTLPEAAYQDNEGYVRLYYIGRNLSRMSDFHRLDIGSSYHFITKKKREATWNFGIYNVYNRSNPNYLEVTGFFNSTQLTIKQQSFLPILPYITYSLKF